MVGGIFSRNIGTVSRGEHGKLAKSRVGLVGLGGTGGAAFEILVRLGVGNFIIFDGDRFEITNFNRQIYAVDTNMGKLKVDAAARKAKKINPKVRVERRGEEINRTNVEMLEKCDVVLDCTDNVETRRMISSFCKRMKIPYVFCSAGGSMGMVSVFHRKNLDGVLGKVHEG
ncbi:MAG: ThiF family adenylyltransferase, partial [Candidatus Micrarchaeia archaeon]